MLPILFVCLSGCTITKTIAIVKGIDYDDLSNGCPSKTDDKMWVTYSWAKEYLSIKNK